MPDAEPAGNPFWAYSLERYARPGVAEACLALQDGLGADVNLLLFCCWAGHRGHRLAAAELESLLAVSRPWQDEVVGPLRRVRRRLKAEAGSAAPIAALREAVKAAELEAERIVQDRLQACLPLAEGPADEAAPAANLTLYLERIAERLSADDENAVATLCAAGR